MFYTQLWNTHLEKAISVKKICMTAMAGFEWATFCIAILFAGFDSGEHLRGWMVMAMLLVYHAVTSCCLVLRSSAFL